MQVRWWRPNLRAWPPGHPKHTSDTEPLTMTDPVLCVCLSCIPWVLLFLGFGSACYIISPRILVSVIVINRAAKKTLAQVKVQKSVTHPFGMASYTVATAARLYTRWLAKYYNSKPNENHNSTLSWVFPIGTLKHSKHVFNRKRNEKFEFYKSVNCNMQCVNTYLFQLIFSGYTSC